MPCGCFGNCLRRKAHVELTEPLVVAASEEEEENLNHYEEKDGDAINTNDIHHNNHNNITSSSSAAAAAIIQGNPLSMGGSVVTTVRESDQDCDTDYSITRSNLANRPDDDLDDLQKLEKYFPFSTLAERRRFLNAKAGKYDRAYEQMKQYLEWREQFDLDHIGLQVAVSQDDEDWQSCASSDGTLDEMDWRCASEKALSYDEGHPDFLPSVLPQLVRILTVPGSNEHMRDHDGHRILHLLPAQMDPHIASHETFALCIAFYLERKLGRDTMEKMTVVIDVRAGKGWANPRPNKLIPFIKRISSLMERNFPERLAKSILFPLPRAATVIWGVIKNFLDPNTAEKIAVIAGNAATESPPPYKKMEEYMERKVIDRMEKIRIDSFL